MPSTPESISAALSGDGSTLAIATRHWVRTYSFVERHGLWADFGTLDVLACSPEVLDSSNFSFDNTSYWDGEYFEVNVVLSENGSILALSNAFGAVAIFEWDFLWWAHGNSGERPCLEIPC